MSERKKLKKIFLHPITTYLLLTVGVVLLSFILSILDVSATYNSINTGTNELEKTIVVVNNMLSFEGLRYIISNAAVNFVKSKTLSTLIMTLIGLGIAEA